MIHIGNVFNCPPALNVIRMCQFKGIECTLLTTEDDLIEKYRNYFSETKIVFVGARYRDASHLAQKVNNMLSIRRRITEWLNKNYHDDSLLWVVSDVSLKHVGNNILSYRYVLHLMELSEKLRYKKELPFPKINEKKIGDAAAAVVVPTLDRAHITKAWWGLRILPSVLHNKPFDQFNIKHANDIHDNAAGAIIDGISDKKIILYQGIVHRERPLKPFLDAVKLLGEQYVFVTMGARDPLSGQNDNQYAHIPFVQPPFHLEVTSWAHVGVLSYFPVKAQYSILNAVFCAPNKSFEYARFGIPMISNDIPGMTHTINEWHCGKVLPSFSSKEIAYAVSQIESNYLEYSRHSYQYYNSVDLLSEFDAILVKAYR